MKAKHSWKFFRAGGFDQVRIETGADLLALDQLDQKLWLALACPTVGLEFDARTLAMIDSDKDGRIRAPEIIAAVKWATDRLKNADDLLKGAPELPLSVINDATPEGRQLLSSAREILSNLGKAGAESITIEDTLDTAKIFAQTRFNGDGIVPPDAAGEPVTQTVMEDIIACFGAEKDRSGKLGVTQARVDQFFAESQAYLGWHRQAEGDATILPLGEGTLSAASACRAIRAKVDDFFARCRLAAYDPRSLSAVNREEKEYLAFAAKDLTITSAEIAAFPIAHVGAGKAMPLLQGINPAWGEAMARFAAEVAGVWLSGRTEMTEADWNMVRARFAPHEAWLAGKTGTGVEKLGLARIRLILDGPFKAAIDGLIAKDKALEPEANAIEAVERLARYYRDLNPLLHNFVSFRDFYSRKDKAIFQAGTLYLDQRACELCIAVTDPARHATMAGLSGTYLAYCDCTRKGSGESRQIVAAFTGGDADNLMVGRNGIFYDRKGRDWDATITKLVDNPISIRQGFWAPYKKAARIIREQVTKQAAAADEAVMGKISQTATAVETAALKGGPPPAPRRIDPGMIAALGVGAAGLGGMIGGFVSGFLSLGWLMPVGVAGMVMIISGPSMLLAWLKLHRRNLGPILDANGWAVNAKARINVPFGASLTQIAALPPGAQRDLVDPFAEKKRPWKTYLVLAGIIVLAFSYYEGSLNRVLPLPLQSISVLKSWAPGYVRPAGAPLAGGTNAPAVAGAVANANPTAGTNAPAAAKKPAAEQ